MSLTPSTNPDLFGHSDAEALLLQWWQQGRMPSSLMLCGQKGIGKATLAYRLARFVLAGGEGGSGGFFGPSDLSLNEDDPVFRRVASGAHGDFMLLTPEMDEKKQTEKSEINAAQARAIPEFLSKTPAESQWRVVLIDSADALNEHAANALLKPIEEPPAKTLVILVAHNPGRLLPTIRSRCRKLNLHAPASEEFHRIVEKLSPDMEAGTRELLRNLSHGAPGLAMHYHANKALDAYEKLLNAMAHASDAAKLQSYAEHVGSASEAKYFPQWAELWRVALGRIAQLASGAAPESQLFEGEEDLLQQIAGMQLLTGWLSLAEEGQRKLDQVASLYMDKTQTVAALLRAIHRKGAKAA